MWLYMPNCTSSPSAPAAEGSISASSWQFQVLAQSAWSRGKPSPSRTWFQRWKRVSWLQHLCGAMPEPSTAARGVDAWTASLAVYRASLTALPESGSARTTSATCGLTPGESSSSPEHGSSCSKTSAGCSPAAERSAYGETFADWALRLREDSSRRRKSGRRMRENGSSSSQWPTADATNRVRDEATLAKCAAFRKRNTNQNTVPLYLAEVAQSWPTPQARDGDSRGSDPSRVGDPARHGGYNLDDWAAKFSEASAWPTPSARDWKGANGPEHLEKSSGSLHLDQLPNFVEHIWSKESAWPTPAVTDSNGARNRTSGRSNPESKHHDGVTLNDAIVLWQASTWSTPRSSDGEKDGPNQSFGAGGIPLPTQAVSLPVLRNSTDGEPSSSDATTSRRQLNPRFVAWLMGWPQPASTGCGFSETASCRFRPLWRSALSQLASPSAGPPAQLALFG
jgi:hypothetical protein